MSEEKPETPKPPAVENSQHDPDQIEDEEEHENGDTETPAPVSPSVTASRLRRAPKRKRKGSKRRVNDKNVKKLEILSKTLNPIPFVPPNLQFSLHEKLLKRLGLWDFVHLEFDRNIHTDLIAQLVANYGDRCSYVNGSRINVARPDLARALKLPVKKDKDSAEEAEESEESIGFVEELLSKWVLLHGEDDMWMMPSEVSNWIKTIKEGHLEKLDWASIIWFMVEKELKAPELGNCYYASHLQCLIKNQKEELLEKESEMEVGEGTTSSIVEMEVGEGTTASIVNMGDGDDDPHGGLQLEEHKHNVDLTLGGQEEVEKESILPEMEVDGNDKVLEPESRPLNTLEPESRPLNTKNEGDFQHPLQRCNLGSSDCKEDQKGKLEGELEEVDGHEEEVDGHEEEEGGEAHAGGFSLSLKGEASDAIEEVEEIGEDGHGDEEMEEAHDGGFSLSLKGEASDAIASANLLEGMTAAQLPYSTGLEIQDGSSGDFFVSRIDAQSIPVSASFLGKRDMGHESGSSYQSLNGNNKRLRFDDQCLANPSNLNECLQQIHQLVGKAGLFHAEREQSHSELTMNQQMLLDELQKKQRLIDQLQKAMYENQSRRQMEVYRLERELYMMGNLLDGYRKALKETHQAFAEYRARFSLPDEPLYKDVKGSGGLVLGPAELEKLRLKQEEEERASRLLLERNIKDFAAGWFDKLEAHSQVVFSMSNRLSIAKKDVKQLKDLHENRQVSEKKPENVPSDLESQGVCLHQGNAEQSFSESTRVVWDNEEVSGLNQGNAEQSFSESTRVVCNNEEESGLHQGEAEQSFSEGTRVVCKNEEESGLHQGKAEQSFPESTRVVCESGEESGRESRLRS